MFSRRFALAALSPLRTHNFGEKKTHAKLPCTFAMSNYLQWVCISGQIITGADETAQFSFILAISAWESQFPWPKYITFSAAVLRTGSYSTAKNASACRSWAGKSLPNRSELNLPGPA